MLPARPRSTKLINNTISNGRLKNNKIQSAPGLIKLNNCNPLLLRKNFSMGFALFCKNTGGNVRKGDSHFVARIRKLIILLVHILLTHTHFLPTRKTHTIVRVSTDIDNILDTAFEIVSIFCIKVQTEFFWPHRDCYSLAICKRPTRFNIDHTCSAQLDLNHRTILSIHDSIEEIRLTDKIGHKFIRGAFIDLFRFSNLECDAFAHHGNTVTHGQSFFLIMSDVDKCNSDLTLKGL